VFLFTNAELIQVQTINCNSPHIDNNTQDHQFNINTRSTNLTPKLYIDHGIEIQELAAEISTGSLLNNLASHPLIKPLIAILLIWILLLQLLPHVRSRRHEHAIWYIDDFVLYPATAVVTTVTIPAYIVRGT
jgi:hypothetical protein